MKKVVFKNIFKKNKAGFDISQSMKKKAFIIGVSLFFVMIVVILAVIVSARVNYDEAKAPMLEKGMISIGLRGDLAGFAQRNEKDVTIEGYEADIAAEIIPRLFREGIKVQYREINSKTGKVFLNSGELDMSLAAYVADTSVDYIAYSEPYFTDAVVFYSQNTGILSISDLAGKKVGVVTTSYAGERLTQYFKDKRIDCTVVQYASYPDAADALAFGNIDVFAGSSVLMRFIASEAVKLTESILPHGYCIAINKDNAELKKALDSILREMKKDGTIDRLEQKWQFKSFAK